MSEAAKALFGRPSWDQPGSTPLEDLEEFRRICTAKGYQPVTHILPPRMYLECIIAPYLMAGYVY